MTKQDELARNAYAARNHILRKMGFESYDAYLSGPLWKSIRARVLLKSKRCSACTRVATQVHHGRYTRENLAGTDLGGLYPICRQCHESIEFSRDGIKLTPGQATHILESRMGTCRPKLSPKKRKRRGSAVMPKKTRLPQLKTKERGPSHQPKKTRVRGPAVSPQAHARRLQLDELRAEWLDLQRIKREQDAIQRANSAPAPPPLTRFVRRKTA